MSAVAKFAVVGRKEGIKRLGAVSHGADLEQAQPARGESGSDSFRPSGPFFGFG
uniref:Uncharacterized protein n=1 Tax=Oryza sativa subsp. japonica TaxID=39947 RepID=Q6H5N5_ORYSJ|nr:hypothetical protein [Oryza sativa Japonica Group]